MKRLAIISVAILSVFATSCSKEQEIVSPSETTPVVKTKTITITASLPGDNTKMTLEDNDGTVKTQWEEGDAIALVYNGSAYKFEAESGGSNTTSFTGEIDESIQAGDKVEAYYPYDENVATNGLVLDYTTMTYSSTSDAAAETLTKLNKSLPMYKEFEYDEKLSFSFENQVSIVKVTMNVTADIAFSKLSISSTKGDIINKGTFKSGAWSDTGTGTISVEGEYSVTKGETYVQYLAVPPQDKEASLVMTLSDAEGTLSVSNSKSFKLVNGKCYNWFPDVSDSFTFKDNQVGKVLYNALDEGMVTANEDGTYSMKYRNAAKTDLSDCKTGKVNSTTGNTTGYTTGMPIFAAKVGDTSSSGKINQLSFNADNATIESFDEFQYFTSTTSLNSQYCTYYSDSNNSGSMGHYVGFFGNCSSLKSVILPPSLTTIGKYAFQHCKNLENIVIPSSVKTIEDAAFNGCMSLTSLEIPNTVESIGNALFEKCTSLTSVKLPDGITEIPSSMFNGCSSLIIDIPSTVTSIRSSAFAGCSSLTSVNIPSGVTEIEVNTFADCTGLTSIDLTGITSIGESAFYGCTGFTSIVIPDSVTSLGGDDAYSGSVFSDCTNLESVEISKNVTAIRSEMFYNCVSLKTVKFKGVISGDEAWGYDVFGYDEDEGYSSFTENITLTLANGQGNVEDLEWDEQETTAGENGTFGGYTFKEVIIASE